MCLQIALIFICLLKLGLVLQREGLRESYDFVSLPCLWFIDANQPYV